MSHLDSSRPPEERIQQAITEGPNLDATGRFGPVTKFVRKIVGRAIKYERDFNLEIDVALLDKVHEVESTAAADVEAAENRLQITDDHLRDADEDLRAADQRQRADIATLIDRFNAMERNIDLLRGRVDDVDTRASVASALAAGVAERGGFAYDEMTATPYMADESALHFTDAQGRARLGYRGGASTAPVYAGFEDLFRGSEELIRDRQRVYLDVIGDRAPVIDLGSGRGEMLALLREAGIEGRGVDLDEGMVERARAAGADVHHGDALDFLMKQEDASLGVIFSAQFIEHLPTSLLPELLEIARAKLRPDGLFIAETVNPHSPRALKVFWLDPTHQHPLFPETMLALCRFTGFDDAEIMFPVGGDDLATNLRTCGEYAIVAGAHLG
jgi:SAM-dependent methyltransferase